MDKKYSDQNVAILGFGIEGKSAARYFKQHGAEVTVCERNPDIKQDTAYNWKVGDDYLVNLDEFDLLVRSPGIRPDQIKTTTPITTGTILALEQYREQIIGITGTKGKGTTATLMAKLLESTGKNVHLGGNIGNPVFEFLDEVKPDDVLVLELSSFQLIDIKTSPHIATVVMMETDHLDWHPNISEYIEAKHQIVAHQTSGDKVVYWGGNEMVDEVIRGAKSAKISVPGKAVSIDREQILIGDTPLLNVSEIALPGRHNIRNAAIAIATTSQLVESTEGSMQAWQEVLRTFSGLKYRLQKVAESSGTVYVNDSVSTTPGTAAAAIVAYSEPRVVILGGRPKGGSFEPLAEVAAKADGLRGIVLIGEATDAIAKELSSAGFDSDKVIKSDSLETAVDNAEQLLVGDKGMVILSPGCASFDMFQNIYDRGEQFNQIVHNR